MTSRMERTIELAVPADFVWAFASDPRRVQPALTAGAASVRLLDGRFDAVGCRFVVTTTAGPSVTEAEHEITTFDPPHAVTTTVISQGTIARTDLTVVPDGLEHCRLTLRGEMEWGWSPAHLFGRLVNALFGRVLLRQSLDRLGAVITEEFARASAAGARQPPAGVDA